MLRVRRPGLQWGRVSDDAEMLPVWELASNPVKLQWGRVSDDAEMPCGNRQAVRWWALQWGRVSDDAEIRSIRSKDLAVFGFNGAASVMTRKWPRHRPVLML